MVSEEARFAAVAEFHKNRKTDREYHGDKVWKNQTFFTAFLGTLLSIVFVIQAAKFEAIVKLIGAIVLLGMAIALSIVGRYTLSKQGKYLLDALHLEGVSGIELTRQFGEPLYSKTREYYESVLAPNGKYEDMRKGTEAQRTGNRGVRFAFHVLFGLYALAAWLLGFALIIFAFVNVDSNPFDPRLWTIVLFVWLVVLIVGVWCHAKLEHLAADRTNPSQGGGKGEPRE